MADKQTHGGNWGCTDRVREPRTPAEEDLGTGQHPKGTKGQTQGTSCLPQRLLSGSRIWEGKVLAY